MLYGSPSCAHSSSATCGVTGAISVSRVSTASRTRGWSMKVDSALDSAPASAERIALVSFISSDTTVLNSNSSKRCDTR